MKYFKDEIFELLNMGGESGDAEYKNAYRKYMKEYMKAKKKLPQLFTEVYEKIGFHDALIPQINISIKYQGFNRDDHGNSTSLELAIHKYSSKKSEWQGWMIVLENIRNLAIAAESERKSPTCIDTFHHDELLLSDNGYVSWEINAIDACLKIEFRKLKIRELSESEMVQFERR